MKNDGVKLKNNGIQKGFLKQAVEGNRIPQAMIFSGPEDTGKEETALGFVKLLKSSGDLLFIKPINKEIQIGQIRDLQKWLSLRPRMSKYKIAVIKQAECLNTDAQNCLLKTLEEPNQSSLLILITSKLDSLLPTIRSRCQTLKFYPRDFRFRGLKYFDEVERVLRMNLGERLLFCQKFSDKENYFKNLTDFLEGLENYLRLFLLKKIGLQNKVLDSFSVRTGDYSVLKIRDIIEKTEEMRNLIAATNVNPKLAFEALMLNI